MMFKCLFLLTCLFVSVLSMPFTASDDDVIATVNYLIRYGYLKKVDSQYESKFIEALQNFQRFFDLPPTGIIDEESLKIMTTSRCASPDDLSDRSSIVGGWTKKDITYYIGTITPKLTERQVADTLRKALNMWGAAAHLTFTRIYNKTSADIVIFFASGAHEGDNNHFDGPGKTVAHAFGPPNGDLHFDIDEIWSVTGKGLDLFSVALHELGHSMGLSHSKVFESVMFPTYRVRTELSKDDIDRIEKIYGPN